MIPDVSANERAFIGCLLRSPHEFWQVNELVTPECLLAAEHRDIYAAIRSLSESGRVVTITSLQASLPEEYPESGPTIAILMALKASAAEAGSATEYAPMLAERSAQRRLQKLGDWLKKETGKVERSAEEISAEAALLLQSVITTAMPHRPKRIGEIAATVSRQASSAQSGEVVSGLTTGLGPLDEIVGLMLPGDLLAIIASQADGKSSLATQIGMHNALEGRPVLLFEMEMSDEQIAARELAASSGVPVNQIHEGTFDLSQWDRIADAERALRPVPFHVLDVEQMTVRQMKAQAAAMQRTTGLSLVIIDQLDKIKAEGKYRDRFERMAEVTGDLKRMAKALRLPAIVLAQRTRGAQRRDDDTPDVLDADAPSLERDADVIVGLWQRANWLRRNKPDGRSGEEGLAKWQAELERVKGMAEVISLKRRRGPAFQRRRLSFHGPTMRFSEWVTR